MPSPVILGLLLLILAHALRSIYHLLSDPLRAVPGPLATRFTRLWEVAKVHRGDFEKTNIALHNHHGPVVRLSPGRYSIRSEDFVKKIYGPGAAFPKSQFYHAFGDPDFSRADLFSEQDIHRHSAKRRKVASLYSLTTLLSYEPFVNSVIAVLQNTLDDFARNRSLIDVTKYMQFCAFDIIGEITVGESFGYLTEGRDFNGIIEALDESSQYACRVGLLHGLHPKLAALMTATRAPIPFDVIAKYLNHHVQSRQAKSPSNTCEDFLTKLLRLRESEKLEDLDVFTTLGANIAVGSETTGLTLSAIIYHLCKNPNYVTILREELSRAYRLGCRSDPITYTEAKNLPLLNAVIKEGLRIHPATNQPLSRLVPNEGATIAGFFFPGGTEVGVNSWVLHYDKEVFGEDCDKFRPERRLDCSEEQLGRMNGHYIPFGSGARTCIGKNISVLEITKILPQLYRKYDFELEHPEKEWSCAGYWFVKPSYRCYVKVRGEHDRV